MKKLIAGNWKMNGSRDFTISLSAEIARGIEENPGLLENCDFLVCPPYPYIMAAVDNVGQNVFVGAQDCSTFAGSGAYTGDISAAMLKDTGCSHVILGHSERRQYHGESSRLVSEKVSQAHGEGLVTIICVGETEEERENGREEEVVAKQLEESIPAGSSDENNIIIAYEPVWAIGTGKTATIDDISKMHSFIRKELNKKVEKGENIRILYGGSVKPDNAPQIFAVENVGGALIGGASLKSVDFLGIAKGA